MAKITDDVPCAACGQMNRVTLTKKRVGEKPPEAEYEVTHEVSLVGGGLFAGAEEPLEKAAAIASNAADALLLSVNQPLPGPSGRPPIDGESRPK